MPRTITKHYLIDNTISTPSKLGTDCWEWQLGGRGGYGTTNYYDGTRFRSIPAHRASYQTFIGPIPVGMQVCHHCDNPPCINPNHLFVGTNRENQLDSKRKGRNAHGENHGKNRLTEEQVIEIRRSIQAGIKFKDLATKYGVRTSSIGEIAHGRNWRYLIQGSVAPGHAKGEHSAGAKLTEEKVMHIRMYLNDGISIENLATKYCVSKSAIERIKNGRTWKHLQNRPVWSTPKITEIGVVNG